jgi:hypothetical protein
LGRLDGSWRNQIIFHSFPEQNVRELGYSAGGNFAPAPNFLPIRFAEVLIICLAASHCTAYNWHNRKCLKILHKVGKKSS